MKNFYFRLISSIIIGPLFLYSLYKLNYFSYTVFAIILIISFYEIYNNVKQIKLSFFLYFLVIFFIYSIITIRGNNYESYIYCVWILCIVWCSDIGGYVIGKSFKGPKLSIYSPNKTISGFCGSVLFSQLSILIPFCFLINFSINYKFIILQLILSIISITGDIFFSYIKRINNIKDYSNIIPGHGGVLDRIDGTIFVIIFYYFVTLTNVI